MSISGWRALLKNIVSLTPYWGSVVYKIIVAIKWQDGLTKNDVTLLHKISILCLTG